MPSWRSCEVVNPPRFVDGKRMVAVNSKRFVVIIDSRFLHELTILIALLIIWLR